ncbi:MAG: protein-L-isoaspartate(D-aspartate) O-methyltransferase, partial [Thermoguttaceae bacterium]
MNRPFSLLLTALLFFAPVFCQAQNEREMTEAREKMVQRELVRAGIRNPDVLEAMRSTLRHKFVPKNVRAQSYEERALPIGYGQTISSPFVVASMTEALNPQPDDRVLEIGTGSGYQAAVLSPLVAEVYSIEIVEPLAKQAQKTLKSMKYKNVFVRAGDGYKGWPEAAPFDKIIVTCSPESPPPALVKQLKDGGLMVVPLGERYA